MVLITGHASVETAVQALRLGATDYLIKPVDIERLKGVLSRRDAAVGAAGRGRRAARRAAAGGPLRPALGRSPPMQRVYELIARVAGTAVTVFIIGESGTGKELVAQTVHDLSRRRDAARSSPSTAARSRRT